MPFSFADEPILSADIRVAALLSTPKVAVTLALALALVLVPLLVLVEATAAAVVNTKVVAVGDSVVGLLISDVSFFFGFSIDSSWLAFACGVGGATGVSLLIAILQKSIKKSKKNFVKNCKVNLEPLGNYLTNIALIASNSNSL